MARDAKIIIRVPDEIKEDFQTIAESMGMTMSSLGAYCIGKFLNEEKNKKEMHEKMIELISPKIISQLEGVDLNNPKVLEAMTDTFNFIAKQQQK